MSASRKAIGRPGHAGRLSGDADAPALQVGKRDLVTRTRLAEHQIGRQRHVLENDLAGIGGLLAQLLLHAGHLVAGCIRRDDKGGYPLLALRRFRDREDDGDIAVPPGHGAHPGHALRRGDRCIGPAHVGPDPAGVEHHNGDAAPEQIDRQALGDQVECRLGRTVAYLIMSP